MGAQELFGCGRLLTRALLSPEVPSSQTSGVPAVLCRVVRRSMEQGHESGVLWFCRVKESIFTFVNSADVADPVVWF